MIEALDRIGRRSGNHLSNRMLRTFDRTVGGNGWKRTGAFALETALLVAGGLYIERDHLPAFGATTAAAPAQPVVATPTTSASVVAAARLSADVPAMQTPVAALPSVASDAGASGLSSTSAKAAPPHNMHAGQHHGKPTATHAVHAVSAHALVASARNDTVGPFLQAPRATDDSGRQGQPSERTRQSAGNATAWQHNDRHGRDAREQMPGWLQRCATPRCRNKLLRYEQHHPDQRTNDH